LRDGQAPDRALVSAQAEMIRAGGEAADPAAWAAFVINGDAATALFTPGTPIVTWLILLAAAGAALALIAKRARRSANLKTARR
jgi:hypothetical protein